MYASLVRAQQLSQNPNDERAEEPSARDEGVTDLRVLSERAETSLKVKANDGSTFQLITLLWKLNQPERYYILIGMICSLLAGAGSPMNGVFFGDAVIALTDLALSTGGWSLDFWALMYLMLGLVLFAIASEAVSAVRTVAALTLETTINRQYAEYLRQTERIDLANDFASAFRFALSQSLPILVNAILFWYGGTKLIGTGEYTVQQFCTCYLTITLAAAAAGTIFSYAPDIAGASGAAARLRVILESTPTIDAASQTGAKTDDLVGKIDLQEVDFAYPARPQHMVLQKIDLSARAGHLVALVGGSGSGKSTVLNLIERFYDQCKGEVLSDKSPFLQDTTPLSAPAVGQKQRIAIAKALLRDPKILLLDEATSALEPESE
ncbi:Fc.00g095430.m01.CDS01, partial [Cosmosporella sp. VM-42]